VVANQKMNLAWILTFEGGDEVEKLVRPISAGWIAMRPVDRLLQDELSRRIAGEVGDLE